MSLHLNQQCQRATTTNQNPISNRRSDKIRRTTIVPRFSYRGTDCPSMLATEAAEKPVKAGSTASVKRHIWAPHSPVNRILHFSFIHPKNPQNPGPNTNNPSPQTSTPNIHPNNPPQTTKPNPHPSPATTQPTPHKPNIITQIQQLRTKPHTPNHGNKPNRSPHLRCDNRPASAGGAKRCGRKRPRYAEHATTSAPTEPVARKIERSASDFSLNS